jgi:serine/threonine-protein kinase
VDNLDPALERVILHCMQDAPEDRPASAYEVLAELPGGDPLAAALAAGETPAPEVVAAARVRDRERPAWVGAVAGALVAGLFIVAILGGRTCFLSQAGLTKPPAVLDEKARQILRTLTGDSKAEGVAQGFVISTDGLAFLQDCVRNPDWRSILSAGRPAVVVFKYAQETETPTRWALAFDPRLPETRSAPSRSIMIQLDGSGRLLHYLSAERLPWGGEAAAREPDWAAVFEMASLDLRSMTAAKPRQTPPVYADRCVAWEGPCPERPGERLRVEGASAAGRVIYFHIARPWEAGAGPSNEGGPKRSSWRPEVMGLLFLATLLVAAPLAWRNTRVGRGDRRGARRLALFLLAVSLMNWLVGRTHFGTLSGETASLTGGLRTAVFAAVVMWIYYLALEPSVRRFWPHSLISWSRLLAGRVADPLVGRDAMIGVAFGLGVVLLRQLHSVADASLGLGAFATVLPPDIEAELGLLSGYRFILTQICHAVIAAIGWGVILVMLMLVLRVALKTPLLGSVVFLVTVTTAIALGSQACGPSAWLVAAVMAIASGLAVVRCGLLTAIVGMFAHQILIRVPLTADRSNWYAESTAVAAVVVLALAAFGAYTAFVPRLVRR